ncbi:MAG: ADP-glyceromanno-heptose 6-epimerase [Williamsia sp.]|nr:ADP-glyceromanno-heptose 6-epimerase [Williamsia sp.]
MLNKEGRIVVTGAAGFIGSFLTGFLNGEGFDNLILVDDFSRTDKQPNYTQKRFRDKVERENLFSWLAEHGSSVQAIFHLGARTDTTEFDYSIHQHLNVDFSQKVWTFCTGQKIPLVYASSAATYGSGEQGYQDKEQLSFRLQPLNPYGVSKNEFDKWAISQETAPPFWAGLKFFNVYGPNEYHKARMASVIFHAFNQIQSAGFVKLFKSHRPDFKDGEQLRDFIYVKDVVQVCFWLMQNQPDSGIYNVGTGIARAFKDLVKATFSALDLEDQIEYIDMPLDIREKYQYFTEADMQKLRDAGYRQPFHTLEDGVDDYVRNYLAQKTYY